MINKISCSPWLCPQQIGFLMRQVWTLLLLLNFFFSLSYNEGSIFLWQIRVCLNNFSNLWWCTEKNYVSSTVHWKKNSNASHAYCFCWESQNNDLIIRVSLSIVSSFVPPGLRENHEYWIIDNTHYHLLSWVQSNVKNLALLYKCQWLESLKKMPGLLSQDKKLSWWTFIDQTRSHLSVA